MSELLSGKAASCWPSRHAKHAAILRAGKPSKVNI